jgi:protoporphyrin/coproporphyrin ferrochelatase
MNPSPKRALLLINLGSPKSTKVSDVRTYLREFLMDPYVIDVPWIKRFLLVNGIIAPLRAPKSAKAYREIWTKDGSPLVLTTLSLGKKVQANLGDSWVVRVAMRYQEPSMIGVLSELREMGIEELHVLPLYPQYALSSTESVRAKLKIDLKKLKFQPKLSFREWFYDDPGYFETFAEIIDAEVADFKPDALMFSYHGIPERHVRKIDPTGAHCLEKENCCSQICEANKYCYSAHCFQTTKSIRASMSSAPLPYHISFQSRLGKDPWIKPYTDEVAVDLAKSGVRRLAVASPAFVADCLETLEELAGELRESFIEAGGEDLRLIPSLGDSDRWAHVVSNWYKK